MTASRVSGFCSGSLAEYRVRSDQHWDGSMARKQGEGLDLNRASELVEKIKYAHHNTAKILRRNAA